MVFVKLASINTVSATECLSTPTQLAGSRLSQHVEHNRGLISTCQGIEQSTGFWQLDKVDTFISPIVLTVYILWLHLYIILQSFHSGASLNPSTSSAVNIFDPNLAINVAADVPAPNGSLPSANTVITAQLHMSMIFNLAIWLSLDPNYSFEQMM